MNCPYCGNAMQEGLIYNGETGFLIWEEPKENGSAKLLNFGKNKKKKVVLTQDSDDVPLRYTRAYLCEECRKVIIGFEP